MAREVTTGLINTTANYSREVFNTTITQKPGDVAAISWDDATWILACSFIIFTMQSGFGLLEAGCVAAKNEVNIMVKNAVDVVFGGLTYWMFGYGLSFGMDKGTNPFVGVGLWCVDSLDPNEMGLTFSTYIFQLSFATTATTIVSGAMAERTKLDAYIVFSLLNTVVYCIPAHWLWAENGWLASLGVIDIAGSSGVHLVGGTSGLVATLMLGPRMGRYEKDYTPHLGNATNCIVGLFMLWWGWLGFNCGSTFGISGGKWILAAKSAVTTINGSIGGGFIGISYSYILRNRKFNVGDLVNSVLGGLVAITAGCAVLRPWQAVIIGAFGGFIACVGVPMFDKLKIDDPVAALSVHGLCGIWGMLSLGLFVEHDKVLGINGNNVGLFWGGGFYLLGVQLLACVSIMLWSALITFILLFGIKKTMGLRMSPEEEILGADAVEHDIHNEWHAAKMSRQPVENGDHHLPLDMADTASVIVDTQHSSPGHRGKASATFSRGRSSYGFRRHSLTPAQIKQIENDIEAGNNDGVINHAASLFSIHETVNNDLSHAEQDRLNYL